MITDRLNLIYEVRNDFENEDNKVHMTTTIENISYINGSSDMGSDVNADFQRYIGNKIYTTYDLKGHCEGEVDHLGGINPKLFVVELPDQEIKVGDTWTGEIVSRPDLIFDTLKTSYKCVSINKESITLEVIMDFEMSKNKDSESSQKISRKYSGIYVIDFYGAVKGASLDMSGFSGLSQINGKILINEIK